MIFNCYICKLDKHKINFSKTQLKKKTQIGYPRCKKCITENTVCKELSVDEPSTDELILDEPSTYELILDEPSTDELTLDEPSTDELTVDDSTVDDVNVPPKRLIMIPENDCDFCNFDFKTHTTMKFIDFNLYPHTGWQVCEKCNQICEKNSKQFIINIDILKQEFQDYKFKVIRSNGKIETDWYIAGNGIRYSNVNDFIIRIFNKRNTNNLSKSIPLNQLREWQS